jgi:transcription elongation GreA/GreB family factor
LRETGSGKEETYTILGAWDGDPDRRIISYQTAIGQALLGKKVGERVSLNTDQGTENFEIKSITAVPLDVLAPEVTADAADRETADAVGV